MLVKNWMPGMYAIFNSAGLEKGGGAVIFVAGRREGDGVDENGNVALLSSEFSQRLALAMFDADYVISTYPNSRRLDVLSAILEMERVDVVSAPASTIARWADINLLAKGLKASLASRSEIGEDLRRILKLTFEKAVKEIHAMLWDKLKNATFIFSFSSLTKKRWELINRFVKKKCNLYVSSEIGPFASSLCLGDNLFVFPLNIPVFREDFRPLTRTKRYYGELLVCNAERINIETGDAVILESKNPPTLYREILRMPIKVGEDRGREIYAGGYWREGCEILNSYEIRNAIADIYDGRIFFDIRERKIIVESNAVEVERALKKARGKFRIGCEFRVAEGSFDVRAKREWWVYFVV
ncbi:MAG: hypothetical protein XD40_0344 [Archaeoglobus fulgidus]|uniref:Uncharacterized protein n=1 Tax=Archaeoglobus fulgidus TaxID=2234 RepID=A0A117KMK7_ARCFL|nr:hypothetical protein [Archaeoglobus fulgidus]KUJ94408.1 MAG: hypothetical protein XD40_0344 [Archaeoglobus fulgidus]KUK07398.1 MAG: hypothetical protein XD48_0394 [Archaeoglobus fulgidus]